MPQSHDASYKLLFSEPEMIVDLLQGFVRQPWVESLDFSSLEKVSGSYISDDLRSREDDVIWRVRCRDSWIYIYLLIEFQSSIDRYMAVRLMSYMGLLYQDLIKTRDTTGDGQLPPIVPLVLYNGEARWNAATELSELIVQLPGGLEHYRPALRYLILAEGAYDPAELTPLKNLVAAIFRLENAQTPAEIVKVVNHLLEWLQTPEQTRLRRSFTVWIKRVLLSNDSDDSTFQRINDLTEIRTMLRQRVSEWTREWEQQGWVKGIEKGIQTGLEQGMEKGRAEGLAHEKRLLLRLIERRFSAPLSEPGMSILKDVQNPQQLEQIGDWILECDQEAALLDKLSRLPT